MLGHLKEHLLHDTQTRTVAGIHYKEYPVNVRVEETPLLPVAALARHVIDDAWHVAEG